MKTLVMHSPEVRETVSGEGVHSDDRGVRPPLSTGILRRPSRMTATEPSDNRICPLCGGWNQCVPASAGTFEESCWCTTASISPEALARLAPEQVGKACLCPRCAAGGSPWAPEAAG